ncbi:MAG: transketolase family protein [Lachnospiraceae bacterium]|jgi:transketolase|nr:transketolase family protein [Lachnospiraceae bacterium]
MKIIYNGENDRAFKDVLGATIPRLAEADSKVIYLDADLMSCIGTAKWAAANPDRAINCGIAEANMAGIASGLSAVGFKPIMHTFGPFASRRCYDQIFLSGGYAGNSVTVIGTDPGVCAAFNGGTHMPFEDMALYRAIPTAKVFDITDAPMLEDVLAQCINLEGVKYIRVGRKSNKKVYEEGAKFEIGKGIVTDERGTDAVIIACGIMVAKAMEAAKILADKGINVTVIDMFTVKPIDEELVIKYAKACGAVVTAENHNKIGGLTSAVSEVLALALPTVLEYVAIEDEFGEVGPQDYLETRYDLTAEHIVRKVEKAISRKNA